MQRQRDNKLFKSSDLLVLLLVVSLGLILGVACVLLPGLVVIGLLVAGFAAYAILKKPELALLGILIATASIVFEDQLPMVSVGVSLHVPDFLLLGSFGIIALRWFVDPEFRIVRTPLDWPLLIFFGLTLISTFISIYNSTVEVEEARRGIRVLSYYLTFFVVTNIVRERRQLNFLVSSLFFLASIVAVAMVAQYIVGTAVVIIPGYVKTLNTQGSLSTGVTRILPPGYSIVLLSFVSLLCIVMLERFKPEGWLKIVQIGILGLAFSFTFLRSYWAALFIAFSLLLFILRGYDRQKLFNWGVVAVSLIALIFLVISSNPNSDATRFVDASLERYGTLFDSETFQGDDSSLNWRKLENEYAIRKIASHPLIGMGVRFQYRPWDYRLDGRRPKPWIYDARKSIHNGHYLILLQSGVLGYLSFIWLSAVFLLRGYRYWQSVDSTRMRGVVLGFALFYLVVLISAFANGVFMQWNFTPVIGIVMGTNEVILKIFRQDT